MLDFQQKRKVRKMLYSKTALVILLVLIFILAKATYEIYQKEKISTEGFDEVKNQYDSLKSREDMLGTAITKLNTDTGVDEEIRSKFDVAKPGETVVVVVGQNDASSSGNSSQNVGFWQSILNWFK